MLQYMFLSTAKTLVCEPRAKYLALTRKGLDAKVPRDHGYLSKPYHLTYLSVSLSLGIDDLSYQIKDGSQAHS